MLALLQDYAARFREAAPAAVADWVDGGSGEEVSLAAAEDAWRRWSLRPRGLTDVSAISTATAILGIELGGPIGVAPTGYQSVLHPDGEVATAAGAAGAGALLVVSARASRRYDDIAAATSGPWWAQLYPMRDPTLIFAVARSAARAGAQALVLTVDAAYVGAKARAGRPVPLGSDVALANLAQHLRPGADPVEATEQDPSAGADLVGALADQVGLPVVVKGVLRADEACRLVGAGAAAVIVSNHGGRQLDRAVATARALPEVVDAVGGAVPVLVDGGVRSGLDVLTALALGARAVFLGRPILWALATDGSAGVDAVLDALSADLRHAMALAGTPRIADIDRSFVTPR
ncbi:MAG: alpha-hydroxy acid oxidase [Mycobacteriales bacterium]